MNENNGQTDKKEKKEKKVNTKESRLPSRTGLVFRAIAGGYVIYLAYAIVKDLSHVSQKEYIIFVVFAALFVIGGLTFIATSLKALKEGRYQNGIADVHKEEVSGEQTEIPRKRIEFGETLEEDQKDQLDH